MILLLTALDRLAIRWHSDRNFRAFALATAAATGMNLISPLGGPLNVIAPGSTFGSIALLMGTALMAITFTILINISLRAARAAHLLQYGVGISALAWVALVVCWAMGDSRRNSSWSLLRPADPADAVFAAIYGIWLVIVAIMTIVGTTAALRQIGPAARRGRRRMHAFRLSAVFGIAYGGLIVTNAAGLMGDLSNREITLVAEAVTAPALVCFVAAVI